MSSNYAVKLADQIISQVFPGERPQEDAYHRTLKQLIDLARDSSAQARRAEYEAQKAVFKSDKLTKELMYLLEIHEIKLGLRDEWGKKITDSDGDEEHA